MKGRKELSVYNDEFEAHRAYSPHPPGKARRSIPHEYIAIFLLSILVVFIFLHRPESSVAFRRNQSARRVEGVTSPTVLELQRAAFNFFQYQAYVLNTANKFTNTAHWPHFKSLFSAWVRLSDSMRMDNCSEIAYNLNVRIQMTLENPGDTFWTWGWMDESLGAFSCGFQPYSVSPDELPPDIRLLGKELWVQQLWRLMKGDTPQGMDVTQRIPFYSGRVGRFHSEARTIQMNSPFALAARLMVAIQNYTYDFVDGKQFTSVEVAEMHSSFKAFFTVVCKLSPSTRCQKQLLDSIPSSPVAFIERSPKSLKYQLFGYYGYENSGEPLCHLGTGNADVGEACDSLPPLLETQYLMDKRTATPRKITVVFDFDETLAQGRGDKLYGRPNLKYLLGEVRRLGFEILIWTASTKEYIDAKLEELDVAVDHVLFRNAQWFDPNKYTKDLRRLGRPMADVVIIENHPQMVWMNKKNAILVPDYFEENEKDTSLRVLAQILKDLGASGKSVPDYISHNNILQRKCGNVVYDATEGSGPYYGIGDYTN